MQLQRPFAVVTPTVDGDVLMVLARADEEFTAPQVQRLGGAHSVDGVRRALNRLVEQGIVIARSPSHAVLYRLNREHLAARAVVALAGLLDEFLEQLRQRFAAWEVPAAFAALFGSAARREMHADSDIDIFVVRPTRVAADNTVWRGQLEALKRDASRWTGNEVRVLEYSSSEASGAKRRADRVLADIAREGIPLAGAATYLRRVG